MSSEPAAFDRGAYARIKAELGFDRNYWVMIANHVSDALLLIAASVLHGRGVGGYVASQVLIAVVMFRAFCILHECGHGSAARGKWPNIISGHIASLLCFMPFYPWKLIHEEHHKWTGHLDKDPTASALAKWKTTRRIPWLVRFAWRSWVPFGAGVQQLVFLLYPLQLFKREGWRATRSLQALFSVLLVVVTYTAILWWFSPRVVLVAIGPAVVLYLFITELVNLPHHVDRPFGFPERLHLWEQYQTARSCYYPAPLSELLMLNFNFHIEHHLFPALPWYRLRRARNLVKDALGARYEETIGVAWNVKNRKRALLSVILHDE